MKTKKLNIILIIIIILLVGIIVNLIKKVYLNDNKLILKAMSETEYENSITELNQAHDNYVNYIKESKTKIASAITNMGIETSNDETLEIMANNILKISTNTELDNTETIRLTSNNITVPDDVKHAIISVSGYYQNDEPNASYPTYKGNAVAPILSYRTSEYGVVQWFSIIKNVEPGEVISFNTVPNGWYLPFITWVK